MTFLNFESCSKVIRLTALSVFVFAFVCASALPMTFVPYHFSRDVFDRGQIYLLNVNYESVLSLVICEAILKTGNADIKHNCHSLPLNPVFGVIFLVAIYMFYRFVSGQIVQNHMQLERIPR